MKKLIFVLIALYAFSLELHAQNEVVMKITYDPWTKYSQTMDQLSDMDMRYSGSPDFLEKLEEKGVPNPTISHVKSTIETVVKTGKANDIGLIPLTMEFISTESSDGKKALPDGTIIFGHVADGEMPTLDSIVSDGLDDTFKASLLAGLESTFKQISLPQTPIKIGGSLTVNTPLVIPMAGISIEMDISSIYKLIGIKEGIADFDISQVYRMKTNINNSDIKSTGLGTGKLLYDIKRNFNRKLQMDVEMTLNIKLEAFGIDLKSKNSFTQTTVITDNK